MTFPNAAFWPAFETAGMLSLATVRQAGGPVDVQVAFHRPGRQLPNGFVSTEYDIEFQTADLARVKEGDRVTIWADATKASGERFTVREAPLVQGDGYFSHATLQKT
jgi:hypothetical protein